MIGSRVGRDGRPTPDSTAHWAGAVADESSTPLERNTPGDISDVTIDLHSEETNVHTENITFVPETEINITFLELW